MSKNVAKYLHKEMDKEAGKRHMSHRTKIVATVGPACDTYEQLLELVKAGVNVFRLNFSHGSHEDKARIIEHIRKINSNEPYNIAILGDLQGPKLRVGEMENGGIDVKEGDILTFTNEKLVGNKDRIYVSYPNLHKDVKPGNIILIDDVTNSGKTLLYALKPLLDAHPKTIQTLVLVERMHKLFPVKPDFVGLSISTTVEEHIQVETINGEIIGAYVV